MYIYRIYISFISTTVFRPRCIVTMPMWTKIWSFSISKTQLRQQEGYNIILVFEFLWTKACCSTLYRSMDNFRSHLYDLWLVPRKSSLWEHDQHELCNICHGNSCRYLSAYPAAMVPRRQQLSYINTKSAKLINCKVWLVITTINLCFFNLVIILL